MKKLPFVPGIMLMVMGLVVAPVSAATITNTGPGSTNIINVGSDQCGQGEYEDYFYNEEKETCAHICTINNDTTVDIDVDTDQDANSGDANNSDNTSGGDSSSGDASNDSTVDADVNVDNSGADCHGDSTDPTEPTDTTDPTDPTTTDPTDNSGTDNGNVEGTQTVAPTGGVNAGAGGTTQSNTAAIAGLVSSVALLGYGISRFAKESL